MARYYKRTEPFVDGKRACKKCGVVKAEEQFLMDQYRSYRRGDCIDCVYLQRRIKYAEDHKEINEKRRIEYERRKEISGKKLRDLTVKTCCRCGETKKRDNFHYKKSGRVYSKVCSECVDKGRIAIRDRKDQGVIDRWETRTLRIFKSYMHFDLRKGLDFSLTFDFVEKILRQSCVYCGYPSTGLDRIDNNFGHTENNCLPCCWECNTARMSNFTVEEMKIIGKGIKEVKDLRPKQLTITSTTA